MLTGVHLLERGDCLNTLNGLFEQITQGTGHTTLLFGEAGIGKTSLVNVFLEQVKHKSLVYVGTCDSLFTPRPLGPLYDIAGQISSGFLNEIKSKLDRASIFLSFLEYLENKPQPVVLVFEDVHWADEATVDLIKFLARRITRLRCLFVITYRENEIYYEHPFASVLGELPRGTFTKMDIQPLSLEAVRTMAENTKYSAKEVHKLTNGNPFFVTEILASYSQGIPQNVKDTVLSIYGAREKKIRELWELLSIMPEHIEIELMEGLEPDYLNIIDECINSGVVIYSEKHLYFKHELYRKTIADKLTPLKRRLLNRKILDLLLNKDDIDNDLMRIVHHALEADDHAIVAHFAPLAAEQAARLGAHLEARKLYEMVLEYDKDLSQEKLADFYEKLAYECYLTSHIADGIAAQEKALSIWKSEKRLLKEGNAFRFLSRLYWFNNNRQKAEELAIRAIEILENGFPTSERAMAYSNLSQLKMLSDEHDAAIHWGNKAIDLAQKMNDHEILAHALNNVGTTQMSHIILREGEANLQESLRLALEHGCHEHAARAYTNLGYQYFHNKLYNKCITTLEKGIAYCEERDLDSWRYYMFACLALCFQETGNWQEAEAIANNLLKHPHHPPIVRIWALLASGLISLRKGEPVAGLTKLKEAGNLVLPSRELQRIVPVLGAMLEYEWIYGNAFPGIDNFIKEAGKSYKKSKNRELISYLSFWLNKAGKTFTLTKEKKKPPKQEMNDNIKTVAERWGKSGNPYMQALALSTGTEEEQKQAIIILDELGAIATLEKLKSDMRAVGIKNIPRGPRESTKTNPAQLTRRQVEILHLLKDGLQNKEIAERLFISPKTVDHHISAILSKLVVNSRAKAVAKAQKLDILD